MNDFRRGLEKLLEDIKAEIAPEAFGPYEEGGEQLILEHGTRVLFFDKLLTLLGWDLGAGGNVAEEARIKAETTHFIDYVGLNEQSRAPVMILEVKAWDKLFIRVSRGRSHATERQLLVEAIKHVNDGHPKNSSPVVGEWHDYLDQVAGYVKTSKENYSHDIPCAVLASGQWIVIFTSPARTFIDKVVNEEHFQIIEKGALLDKAETIYNLLNRRQLGGIMPRYIRPTQILDHLSVETTKAAYHGVLVSYASTGTTLFAKIPQILIYPILLLERNDGTLIPVLVNQDPIRLELDGPNANGDKLLTTHLTTVTQQAEALLITCSNMLGTPLVAFPLTDFPGFLSMASATATGAFGSVGASKVYVQPVKDTADEWLIATGTLQHYLIDQPRLKCQFHAWSNCRSADQQIGDAAVSTPCTNTPRAFFVDGLKYHCAHQSVADMRATRCHIAPLDMRTCCSSCSLHSICWTPAELEHLPCGT